MAWILCSVTHTHTHTCGDTAVALYACWARHVSARVHVGNIFLHAWPTQAWFIEVVYLSWPLFIHVFCCFQNPPFDILVPVSNVHKYQIMLKLKNSVILWCLCYSISCFRCSTIVTPIESTVNTNSAWTVWVPLFTYFNLNIYYGQTLLLPAGLLLEKPDDFSFDLSTVAGDTSPTSRTKAARPRTSPAALQEHQPQVRVFLVFQRLSWHLSSHLHIFQLMSTSVGLTGTCLQ